MKPLYIVYMQQKLQKYLYVFAIIIVLPFTLNAQKSYDQYCESGISKHKSNELSVAIDWYTQAVNAKPKEETAYLLRAIAYIHKGNLKLALQDVNTALEIEPNDAWGLLIRGKIYADQLNLNAAITDLNRSLELSKKNIPLQSTLVYLTRADVNYDKKEYEPALSDYKAYYTATSNRSIQREIGLCYFFMGEYEMASIAFGNALDNSPGDLTLQFYLGNSYYKSGDIGKARDVMKEIIEVYPAQGVYFSTTKPAAFYDINSRNQTAEALLQDAEADMEEYKNASIKVIGLLRLEDAFKKLDSAFKYTIPLSTMENQTRDKIMEAFQYVYPLLKTKPQIPEYARKYIVQGLAATESKNYPEAISYYHKALSIVPYEPIIYNNLAFIMEKIDDPEAAIRYMEDYLALAPTAENARSSQDKIYEWEMDLEKQGSAPTAANGLHYSDFGAGMLDAIFKGEHVPGDYKVSVSYGGHFGYQTDENASLGAFYDGQLLTPDIPYADASRLLYGADMEIVIKPWLQYGFGGFFKVLSGIGTQQSDMDVYPRLFGTTLAYGAFGRYYFPTKSSIAPLFYTQLGVGQAKFMGSYDWWDDTNYSMSYELKLTGTAPYMSLGLGIGGKASPSSNVYISLSVDYISTNFKTIEYEVTINDIWPVLDGTTGVLTNGPTNVTANYRGILLKFLLGFAI